MTQRVTPRGKLRELGWLVPSLPPTMAWRRAAGEGMLVLTDRALIASAWTTTTVWKPLWLSQPLLPAELTSYLVSVGGMTCSADHQAKSPGPLVDLLLQAESSR